MIKHIVCFKLKDNSDTNKNETKDILLSMKGRCLWSAKLRLERIS